jgi:multidrug efflux pump subunit AcrB
VIVQVSDKELTPKIIAPLQSALSRQVPGAWITVRQLQTNPVETPVEILISGQADTDAKDEAADIQTLRGIATQAMDVLRQSPGIAVMRDDWSPDSPQVKIQIDPDRANVVGITNADVANSTAAAISGASVGLLKEGNKSIPIVARLRGQERAQLGQIENLYVYSSQQNTRVPLLSVAAVRNILETGRIRRREHFRTISVLCFPAPGVLASEIFGPAQSKLNDLKKNVPPGYQLSTNTCLSSAYILSSSQRLDSPDCPPAWLRGPSRNPHGCALIAVQSSTRRCADAARFRRTHRQ